jgi:hypothetical protein
VDDGGGCDEGIDYRQWPTLSQGHSRDLSPALADLEGYWQYVIPEVRDYGIQPTSQFGPADVDDTLTHLSDHEDTGELERRGR